MEFLMDHRQIAGEMEIYFFDDKIGAGLPVWLPHGVAIRDSLEDLIKELERRAGYQRVVSPHVAREALYAQSGHLKHFSQDMFPPMNGESGARYFLKPMNCPHHHMVFSSAQRSYRQLPLRIAEYGQVYRFEPSGALKGLSRVRGLCQNDAHIYIEPDGALDEMRRVLRLHEYVYSLLGLKGYRYRLSMRDPLRPADFDGDAALWESCEAILREALRSEGLEYFESVGDAAFYGPKIDVQMRIGSGAEESIASAQLDFVSGERFGLKFIDRQGLEVRPWVIHRAPLGSHERFVAMLIEYFQGQLPAWLGPVQLWLCPVSESEREHASRFAEEAVARGLRVRLDHSQGSLSKRVAAARRLRPFSRLVIGPEEVRSGRYSLKHREGEVVGDREELLDWLLGACVVPS